ncbi:MAG: hypothetical protein ABJH68_20400, partial [Ilumatobacter sp.]|uniref:hypothetical protein n=1 Tax=Ilumatobacter sp. TaxID=1967498 RepID=UPI0032995C96
ADFTSDVTADDVTAHDGLTDHHRSADGAHDDQTCDHDDDHHAGDHHHDHDHDQHHDQHLDDHDGPAHDRHCLADDLDDRCILDGIHVGVEAVHLTCSAGSGSPSERKGAPDGGVS